MVLVVGGEGEVVLLEAVDVEGDVALLTLVEGLRIRLLLEPVVHAVPSLLLLVADVVPGPGPLLLLLDDFLLADEHHPVILPVVPDLINRQLKEKEIIKNKKT